MYPTLNKFYLILSYLILARQNVHVIVQHHGPAIQKEEIESWISETHAWHRDPLAVAAESILIEEGERLTSEKISTDEYIGHY